MDCIGSRRRQIRGHRHTIAVLNRENACPLRDCSSCGLRFPRLEPLPNLDPERTVVRAALTPPGSRVLSPKQTVQRVWTGGERPLLARAAHARRANQPVRRDRALAVQTASWERFARPSFFRMLCRWARTVEWLTSSRRAIVAFWSPWATRPAICISRAVSCRPVPLPGGLEAGSPTRATASSDSVAIGNPHAANRAARLATSVVLPTSTAKPAGNSNGLPDTSASDSMLTYVSLLSTVARGSNGVTRWRGNYQGARTTPNFRPTAMLRAPTIQRRRVHTRSPHRSARARALRARSSKLRDL
jgi:hypothetical protein